MERTITAEQTARFAQALQKADRAPGTILHHCGSHQRAQLQEARHRRGLDLSEVSFSPM